MSNINPSDHGIVVEHKETGLRYAVSDKNYNPKVHRKVRDLKPGESTRTYQPNRAESLGGEGKAQGGTGTPETGDSSLSESSEAVTQTEGSASAASQEEKEGN